MLGLGRPVGSLGCLRDGDRGMADKGGGLLGFRLCSVFGWLCVLLREFRAGGEACDFPSIRGLGWSKSLRAILVLERSIWLGSS